MVERNWNELLSAHLDGETSPDEQTLIERELTQSPELQAAWDDLQTMSLLVRSLPRDTAPADLQKSVMQAVVPAVAPVMVAPPPPKRSLKREWTVAGIASLVTCLVIVPMVSSLQTSMLQRTVATNWSDGVVREAAELESSPKLGGVELAQSPRPMAAAAHTADVEFAAPTALGTSVPRDEIVSAGTSEHLALSDEDRDGTTRGRAVRGTNKLEQARVGDVVQYWERLDPNSNTVACIEVTVIDKQRVADELQLLLMRNGAPSLPIDVAGTDKTELDALTTKPTRTPAASSDLFAVYAQAPAESVAQTLDDVADNDMVISLQLQPPFQVDDLPAVASSANAPIPREPLKQQLSEAYVTQVLEPLAEQNEMEDRAANPESKSTADAKDARTQRFSRPQNRSMLTHRNSGVTKEKLGEAPVAGSNSPEMLNFNVDLHIPVPALQVSQDNLRGAARSMEEELVRRKFDSTSLAMKKLSNNTLAGSPIRVLFVLRPVDPPVPAGPVTAPKAP